MSEETPTFKDNIIYKRMFRTKDRGGFISVGIWWEGQKLSVDIGAFDPNTNKSISATKCYLDMFELATFLNAIVNKSANGLYPKRDQCPSAESYSHFGGKASEELSRVFKIHHWGADNNSEGDPTSFVFKCGHFKGKVLGSGAIQPIYTEKLSSDMIKMTRPDVHELTLRLNTALANGPEASWYLVPDKSS